MDSAYILEHSPEKIFLSDRNYFLECVQNATQGVFRYCGT